MKTVKMESPKLPAQRGSRRWLIRLGLLLGLPLLFYYGYCWGLWGRNSLLLQYLFQCGCPIASNETRYPAEVDVIVPACRYENARLLPSGRLLYVSEKRFWRSHSYLLDLQTNRKNAIDIPKGTFYFLTDNLLYVSYDEMFILDLMSRKQYLIQKFVYIYPDAYVDGNANLKLLAEALRRAKHVFLVNDNDTVVALASDSSAHSEDNFIADSFDIPGFDADRLERFLSENNILYESMPSNFPDEVISPDKRFIGRHDGIYLLEIGLKIVDAYPSRLRGWTNDSRGVIYSSEGPCLIQTNFFIFDDTACLFRVSQPVLLLKVPEEYLILTPTP